MKIAVCISGGIKHYEKSLRSISKIYPNDFVKVFIHTWSVGDSDFFRLNTFNPDNYIKIEDIESVLDLYGYESCEVEVFSEKENIFRGIFDGFSSYERSDLGPISMFYSMFKSNELRRKYEDSNLMKFDRVIRMRFDSDFVDDVFDAGREEFSNLSIPYGRDWLDGINDQFAIGSSDAMNVYSCLFENIENMKNHMYHGETLLKKHLLYSQIFINRFNCDVMINNGCNNL